MHLILQIKHLFIFFFQCLIIGIDTSQIINIGISLGGKTPTDILDIVAVNRDVYVGLRTMADGIEKLISEATDGFPGLMPSSVLTRLNDIERRLTALESTATTS